MSFNPQWIMREYLARRGGVKFMKDELAPARCSLLGYSLNRLVVEGQEIEKYLLKVELQSEVGTAAYDAGAKELHDFFRTELEQFHNEKDLHPLGKKIIEACFKGASLAEYEALIEGEDFFVED